MKGPAKLLPMDLSFMSLIPFFESTYTLILKSYMVVRNTIIDYIKSVTTFYLLVAIFTGYSLVPEL